MPSSYITSAGNTRYRANWRDESGRQRCKSFLTEDEARTHEAEVREGLRQTNVRVCKLEGCERIVEQIQGRGRREFCSLKCKQEHNNGKRDRKRPAAELRPPAVCKLEECDALVPQNPTGRPGLFCSHEHARTFHNRKLAQSKGPDARHIISNPDESTMTGTCSICGPDAPVWTTIDKTDRGMPRKRWRCATRTLGTRFDGPQTYKGSRKAFLTKLRHNHGLSEEQWDALLIAQSGRCGACGEPMKSPHVDHDHETMFVRGLLCQTCNTGLGKLGDTEGSVVRALEYLRADHTIPAFLETARQS